MSSEPRSVMTERWFENIDPNSLMGEVLENAHRDVEQLHWLLAEARWWAARARDLYSDSLDEFAPFWNLVWRPLPWEPAQDA